MTSLDDSFLADVLAGLSKPAKTLPCKYLYDARGSELFEQICDLEEYYPTRADLNATERNIVEIAKMVGPNSLLVELGSGSSTKTRVLLDHLEVAAYVPIDISQSALDHSAAELRKRYPSLDVRPLTADYTAEVELPKLESPPKRTVIYFPGSTIGNFHPPAAVAFLKRIRIALGDHGVALIGVDLKKDKATLERAYDDAKGITAQFNLNLLQRINKELGANFALDQFEHLARYDESLGRIEMHLVSKRAQSVALDGHVFEFAARETIRTEESYKYSVTDFARVCREAGLAVDKVFTDDRGLFSLQYLTPNAN